MQAPVNRILGIIVLGQESEPNMKPVREAPPLGTPQGSMGLPNGRPPMRCKNCDQIIKPELPGQVVFELQAWTTETLRDEPHAVHRRQAPVDSGTFCGRQCLSSYLDAAPAPKGSPR